MIRSNRPKSNRLNAIIIITCLSQLVIVGCVSNEPMPEITSNLAKINSIEKLLESPPPRFKQQIPINNNVIGQWLPTSYLEKGWTAVVVHHSETENGNAAIFDKFHREEKHWEGVGYHFVIGNGTNSGDGQVEPTYRWTQQKTGAHCGGTDGNWANRDGVGICLVGDFSRSSPTSRQMQSLLSLVRFLQQRYRIGQSQIYGHGDLKITACPGGYFPMAQLKSMLD
jgi:N-acetyl-anhydromuramyl-L-alanine amidase AmpD